MPDHDAPDQAPTGDRSAAHQIQWTLRAILDHTTAASDEEFPIRTVQALADALGFHTVFMGELIEDAGETKVRALAVWSHGGPAEQFEYPLAGTPCDEVFRTGFLRVNSGAVERFPDDPILATLNADCYLGAALVTADGRRVGHLAALTDRSIQTDENCETILRIFASRAASHLDLRTVEGRLRDVEDNFQLLFEQSPSAIVLFDPDTWSPIEFNDLAAEFMGYTREEFAKLTITDLEMMPDPAGTSDHIQRILQSGSDVFEGVHKAKDGSPRHVIVSLKMTTWKGRPVMLTLWHDITARRAAEQALEASRRRLQSILDTALDAVVIIDGDRCINDMNPAAASIFQCTRDSALGRPIQDFFPTRLNRLLKQAGVGSGVEGSGPIWAPKGLNARRLNGDVFPVELTLSPFEIDGATFFTIILRDVDARLAAENELRQLQDDKRLLQEQLSEGNFIVGESLGLAAAFSHVEKVAVTDSTVLILGETGTGKELIARAIHEKSVRRDRVMVTVNCAALPKELLESELFGHEKGAFTGASQRRRGRFELASSGTLFLDEVGELSVEAQAKLLRALQEGEIQRVGGEKPIRVNVRVIAATHQDLMEAVKEGRFRSDLYYRLSVFPLRLPPLRERLSDIPLLVNHFVSMCAKRFGRTYSGFDTASLERLSTYHWPGNVRELQNVIERAAILSAGPELTLDGSLFADASSPVSEDVYDLEVVTGHHVRRVLTECDWVIEGPKGAAIRLGINPSTLRFRMKKLGIAKP